MVERLNGGFEQIEAVVGRSLDSGDTDFEGLEAAGHKVEAGRMGVERAQGFHMRAGRAVADIAVDQMHLSFVARG